MFSHTVRLSASMKCWYTMPMPAAMASRGRAEVTAPRRRRRSCPRRAGGRRRASSSACDLPAPFSPTMAWIAAGAHGQVDAVVGDDAGEALDDVAQLDGAARRPPSAAGPAPSTAMRGCSSHRERPRARHRDATSARPADRAGTRRASPSIAVIRASVGHLDLAVDDLLLRSRRAASAMSSTKPPDVGVADAVAGEVEHVGRRRRTLPSTKALIVSYTATSTCLSIDVRMYGCRSASTRLYWSLSTPMAQTSPGSPASAAASKHAEAGAAGGGVDDVGAVVVHRRGDLLALGRVVEAGEVRRLGDVLRRRP